MTCTLLKRQTLFRRHTCMMQATLASMAIAISLASLNLRADDEAKEKSKAQPSAHSDEHKHASEKQKQDADKPKQAYRKRATDDRQPKDQRGDKASDKRADMRGPGESPALGVIVGSCPGNAVCVLDTIMGSPADDAGLREGDYILRVNDQMVTSPQKLREVVDKQLKVGEKVTLKFWRHGDEMTKEVTLASKAEQPPESHRAWLGVLLTPGESEGLRIGRILPNSPADRSDLEEGDVLVDVNGKRVSDVQTLLDCIGDLGPGAEVTMVVQRDDQKKSVEVQLGDVEEAPMSFIREALQMATQDAGDGSWQEPSSDSSLMEETLDEMRSRIRALEQQVKELQGDSADEDGQASTDASSAVPAAQKQLQGQETLVVQRDRDWDRDRGRDREFSRRSGYTRNYNYYPNNRWPYRSGYRYGNSPYYRSPGYGHSYYRYGGRPYYYGGYGSRYGYGLRSGIQLGRNFGIYW